MTKRLPSATEARTEKTADGSLTLGWDASSVTYRSRYGAWTEANHVFIEGAAALSHTQPRIFEFGLGAATNLFATLAALLDSPAPTHLIYETLEAAPLAGTYVRRGGNSYPMNDSLKQQGLKLLSMQSRPARHSTFNSRQTKVLNSRCITVQAFQN